MARTDVTFSSDGVTCRAWLYRPAADEPAPLIVMAHGFSATREQRLDAYAERFCAHGIGALVFDYRSFGASDGEPRQLLDISAQQADFHAAVAHARSLHWVDPERIALFGSSFSGGHVLAVGAADRRIAAIVAQCPFTDGLATLPKLGLANLRQATVAGLRDQLGALAGRPPHYVPAVGPPDAFAVMNSPDAQPGFAALTPSSTLWENRVAARVALRIGLYRPGRRAARLDCPVLFCVCEQDVITPPGPTLRYASSAPRGEIRRYPVGHFEIYVGPTWEQAVADQTDFLTRVLGAAHRGA
ncbi:MAG: acetylxylan esterase [Actinomycetota bacterium]|nr:acetylxylan esterase [Actinomycetota bacterium]